MENSICVQSTRQAGLIRKIGNIHLRGGSQGSATGRPKHEEGRSLRGLRTLDGAGPSLLRAITAPLAVALLVLVSLVLLKHLVFAIGRSLREMGDVPPRPRTRRHGSTVDEPLA